MSSLERDTIEQHQQRKNNPTAFDKEKEENELLLLLLRLYDERGGERGEGGENELLHCLVSSAFFLLGGTSSLSLSMSSLPHPPTHPPTHPLP